MATITWQAQVQTQVGQPPNCHLLSHSRNCSSETVNDCHMKSTLELSLYSAVGHEETSQSREGGGNFYRAYRRGQPKVSLCQEQLIKKQVIPVA